MTPVIIRACRERQTWVDYLLDRLPGAVVVYDTTRNAMDTFFEALQVAEGRPVIHMEDDALLARRFGPKAESVIGEHPDTAIQFFSMRKKDIEVGSRWEPGRTFLAGVCFYLPAGMSNRLLRYDWPRKVEHPTGLDLMIADLLREGKEKYWLQVPNLAQHRFGRSLIDGRRSRYRQSLTFEEPDE